MPRRWYRIKGTKDWDVRAKAHLRLFRRKLRHVIKSTPRALAHPLKVYRELRGLELSPRQIQKAWNGSRDPMRVEPENRPNTEERVDRLGWAPRRYRVREYFSVGQNGVIHPVLTVEPRVRDIEGTYSGWSQRILRPHDNAEKVVVRRYDPSGKLREVLTFDLKRGISETRNVLTGKRVRREIPKDVLKQI